MLELDFSPILSFDEDSDLNSDCFFIFEGTNPSKSVPDEFAIDPIDELALLKFFVVLKEDSFDHPSFVSAEFEVFLAIGEIDGTAGVYDKVRVD